MTERKEHVGFFRQGVQRLRDLFLPSSGLMIGETRLFAKADPSGNIDPYWGRPDGTEMNLTGEVKLARCTQDLALTDSYQSLVGDGDSSKVRVLLPTIGEWYIHVVCDFDVGTANAAGNCAGDLYVNDGGSGETGRAVLELRTVTRATVTQHWKVTTTAADTPVELKVRKDQDVGVATCKSTHTSLAATIGAGGGSTVESVDHGTLTGRGDDDHTQYGQLADAETVPGIWDFTGGLKTDTISESTGAAGVTVDGVKLKDSEPYCDVINEKTAATGVTIDGVLLKDGEVDGVVVDAHAARHTDGSDDIQDAAADDSTKGIATFEADDFDDASGKIDLAASVAKSAPTDSGTATPSTHALTIAGGTGVSTAGAGSTVTINADAFIFRFSITVEDPTNAEDITITFTNAAVTLTEMRAVLTGTANGQSVTWTVRHHTDRSNAGNEVVTNGTATTSLTTGSDVTAFNDATIPADSHIWLETTAKAGTVTSLAITGIGTYD